MRIKKLSALVSGMLALLTLGVFVMVPGAKAEECTIIAFNVQGGAQTYPRALNDNGQIAGYYEDSSGSPHGFLRNSNGGFQTFNAQGNADTQAQAINNAGKIVGHYNDSSGKPHGFLRDSNGNVVTFDPSGSDGTYPQDINGTSTVVGSYLDFSLNKYRGFLRNSNGGFQTFDAPGSVAQGGTQAVAINEAGQIVGYYLESPGNPHGFLRTPDGSPNGSFETIDVPGGTHTQAVAINEAGQIAGWYSDFSSVYHGFLRNSDGSFETFDPPNSIHIEGIAMNDAGQITGSYLDSSLNKYRGFLRDSGGGIVTFDNTSGDTYTFPVAINNIGQIAGRSYDSSLAISHGFLRTCASAQNQPPTAMADFYQAYTGEVLTVAAPGVLGNDSDPEGSPLLTAILDTQPANGTVALNGNGSFTYTPNSSFAGTTTFTYHASDGQLNSGVTNVTIAVAPVCRTTNGKIITGLTSLKDLEEIYNKSPSDNGLATYFNDRSHANPNDPYVDLDPSVMQPGLLTALRNFEQVLDDLPTATFTETSGYRPTAYQAHLYEIDQKRNEINKSGDFSNPFCVDLMTILDTEFKIHKLGGGVDPPGTSQHEVGKAVDMTICDVVNSVESCISLKNKQKKTIDGINIDTLAASSSLNRPCRVKDPVHYSLPKDPVTGKAISC